MKKILFALIALTLIACSDDDGKASPDSKLVKKITTTGADEGDNKVYTFTYDAKNRIRRMKVTGEANLDFTIHYNEMDLIQSIDDTGETPETILVTYNENNRLETISSSGGSTPFTYEESTGTYTYMGAVFQMDQGWNFLSWFGLGIESYANAKGAFYNVKGNYTILQFIAANDLVFVGGRLDFKNIKHNGQEVIGKISVHDEDGFPTQANLGGLITKSVTYKY